MENILLIRPCYQVSGHQITQAQSFSTASAYFWQAQLKLENWWSSWFFDARWKNKTVLWNFSCFFSSLTIVTPLTSVTLGLRSKLCLGRNLHDQFVTSPCWYNCSQTFFFRKNIKTFFIVIGFFIVVANSQFMIFLSTIVYFQKNMTPDFPDYCEAPRDFVGGWNKKTLMEFFSLIFSSMLISSQLQSVSH